MHPRLPVGKTIGNFNNHVGVPLSLLRLPDDCRAGVIEMGMNHAGEIRELAAIARPEIGVVTNVGYAHVEFFDSIEGIAAAKRELIEGLPPDGVAVLNADDPRVARFGEVHPGRSVTFGFAEGAEVRAEDVSRARRWHALPRARRGFRNRTLRPSRGDESAGRDRRGHSLRHRPRTPARRGRAASRAGKMRGERTEHNGIVIWNDCYNSNPEAAQSMIDVLRETPARRRIAVLGEMLELGHAAEELHRQVGRYAAGHGVDLLIGVRGAARAMVESAARAGLDARFFEDPAEAGDRARELAGGRRGPLQGFARREGGEGAGKVYGISPCSTSCSTNSSTGTSARSAFSRYTTVAHGLRQPDRALPLHRAGSLADQQTARVSNRPVHPRRRPQVAPEEGRHADHGRRADHHFDRDSDAALGGPALSLCLDRARRACSAIGWIGFLDDYAKVTKQRNLGLSGKRKLVYQFIMGFAFAASLLVMRAYGDFSTTMNIPFFKQFKPSLLMTSLMANPWTYVHRASRRSASSWRWWWSSTSNAVNLTDGLDGLAIGLMVIAAGALTILTYAGGHAQLAQYLQLARNPRTSELTIFCGSMTGASLGFLWYNAHPAEIFMGDVGSLGLGGAMAVVAVLIKQEVLLLFIGGIFIAGSRLGDPSGGQLQTAPRQAHFQDGAAASSLRGVGLDRIENHRALLDRRPGAGAVRADHVETAMNLQGHTARWSSA